MKKKNGFFSKKIVCLSAFFFIQNKLNVREYTEINLFFTSVCAQVVFTIVSYTHCRHAIFVRNMNIE